MMTTITGCGYTPYLVSQFASLHLIFTHLLTDQLLLWARHMPQSRQPGPNRQVFPPISAPIGSISSASAATAHRARIDLTSIIVKLPSKTARCQPSLGPASHRSRPSSATSIMSPGSRSSASRHGRHPQGRPSCAALRHDPEQEPPSPRPEFNSP